MAARDGIGKDAVAKIWADYSLRPWRTAGFSVSNAPHVESRSMSSGSLDPPARAVMFSYDELDRTGAR